MECEGVLVIGLRFLVQSDATLSTHYMVQIQFQGEQHETIGPPKIIAKATLQESTKQLLRRLGWHYLHWAMWASQHGRCGEKTQSCVLVLLKLVGRGEFMHTRCESLFSYQVNDDFCDFSLHNFWCCI